METFQEIVAAYKQAHALNDTQLGRLLGVSQSTASEWVGGRRIPELERAKALALVLGRAEEDVAAAISYARRRRVENIDQAVALITQLQAEIVRLERRVSELEARDGSGVRPSRSRRPR